MRNRPDTTPDDSRSDSLMTAFKYRKFSRSRNFGSCPFSDGQAADSSIFSFCSLSHERLCLLIQAAGRGDRLVTIGFGVHQAVVDGHVVGEEFELFRVIGEVINLAKEQL
jgi:hypothetical protein